MKSYRRSTYLLLFGILFCGYLNSAVLSKPEGGVENDAQNDYSYSDDEESPKEQTKPPNSTVMPSFETEGRIIYVESGKKLEIDCPVKNYDEAKHSILWKKNNFSIVNGQTPLHKAYQVDKKFSLLVEKATTETAGHYSCIVEPQNIMQTTEVKIGIKPIDGSTMSPGLSQAKETDAAIQHASLSASAAAVAAAALMLQKLFIPKLSSI